MNSACRDCMLNKYIDRYPENAPEEAVKEYRDRLQKLVDQPGAVPTGPEVFHEVRELRGRLFGEEEMDFTEIKRHFNALMLENEANFESRVLASEDPLKRAVQYAMMGNFIDFSALDKVEESKLMELIARAPDITVDEECLELLRERTEKGHTLVLITDNCGEIVMDKILLRQLLRLNPDLSVTVIVRGAPVANDATLEDAEQVGLTGFGRCIGNGNATDGSVMRIMSREAREAIFNADVVIAKGQANYETLYGCACKVFYIFMCKCMLFMDRFKVPQFTGILTYEDPEILFNVYANEALLKDYRFRQILPEEGEQAGEMDRICFPPEEAKPMDVMCRFVQKIPEQFLAAVDRRTGKVAGYLCGISSDEAHFRDEFFTDLTFHDPAARTVYLLGLDILPEHRGRGLAKELLRIYGIWSQVRGKHRLVLTAHEEKIGMYEKLGFADLGISGSKWGGGVWHEMECSLQG